MLLIGHRMTAVVCLLLFCAAINSGVAAEGDAGHGSMEFGLSFYQNSDGDTDGNPFLDEESTIIEPVFIFNYNLSDRTMAWAKLAYDYVSSASIDRLSEFEEQSGASGDNYISVEGGIRRQSDARNAWGLFGHLSTEYDYNSFGFGGDYTRTAADGNSSLKVALNGFLDQLDLIRFNGVQEGSDDRISVTGQINLYQVIDPVTHVEYGGVLTLQSGFLESPYNAVVIEDTAVPNPNLVGMAPGREVTEELEDSLVRGAVFGRVRRALSGRDALELGGRVYADSWGLTGISLEPRWYRWLIDNRLRSRLRYRFYTQTAADAYSEHFMTEETYRTQDSDMGEFSAHSFGGMLTLHSGESSEYDFSLDYVLRDDGIDQILGRFGYRREF